MKKIVTVGATTLTALTLLGVAQPLAHADQNAAQPKQTQNKLASVQQKADTDVVNIPDANLKKLLNGMLGGTRTPDQDITVAEAEGCTGDIAYMESASAKKIYDLTGIEYFKNITQFGWVYQDFSDVSKIPDLSGITKLTALNASNCNLSQAGFEKYIIAGTKSNGWTFFNKNHITDFSKIGSRSGTPWTNFKLEGQTVTKDSQKVTDGKITVAKENLKNIDGTTPTIKIQNGGTEEGENIVWDRLAGSTTSVTYTWSGKNTFSGTVTVPVIWDSDKDKVQADVNLLFKDNTRTELNTNITVQKIETVRKEVNALTDSAEKTSMLDQIGAAYGLYFVVDAKAEQEGDPLGNKVKADLNMTTLHDFVEASTDFEAGDGQYANGKTSNASAGTYDYVRSGWSKAVTEAIARVNSYVAGTDLAQAGLGSFSEDVAHLRTAAEAIQADQESANDSIQVEYNYTAQAPGEPGWYGMIPSNVVLTDAHRGTGELVNVELKNATKVGGNYTNYDGGKTVEVGVKSDNGYKLDDGKGDKAVEYKLDFFDKSTGTTQDVAQDNVEHKIGEMKKGQTVITSHVDLLGNAEKSGKYTDQLFYHFSEK
jgi:hypothetical protein